MNISPELLRFVSNDDVLETFVDSVGLNSCDSKIARIEFCVTRMDKLEAGQQAKFSRHPVCRLVMSLETMAELYNELDKLRRALESQRIKPSQAN